jgi:hypothetical protein
MACQTMNIAENHKLFQGKTAHKIVLSLEIKGPGHEMAVLRILIFTHPGAFVTPGSGIRNRFFPDPGSRILDLKTATKERGEKKLVVIPFYVTTNLTKLKIILVLKF